MTLLLDTSVWVWFLEDDERRLSKKSIDFLQKRERKGELAVSELSFWEVTNKSAKGKLSLSIDATLWLERAGTAPGITYLPIERAALIQSTRLSGSPPNDPMDRILIATALLNRATLATSDATIIAFAGTTHGLSIYDAR